MIIDIYLAHRNSNKFFAQQVHLIKKYFKINKDSQMNIFGYVDGNNDSIKEELKKSWESLNVIPIDIPQIIKGYDRNKMGAGDSYGLAFQYVYENFILKNKHISICIENDIMPFIEVNIEEYVKDYEICGEVRFNAAYLPDRMLMFWLGFIIFNGEKMEDRELWNAESGQTGKPVKSLKTNQIHWIDCGGNSYYWIVKKERKIKHIVTMGFENYNPFTSTKCNPYNITNEIELLPLLFRDNYHPSYKVLIYKDLFIHLEQMGKTSDEKKENWWKTCYNKIK